MILVVKRGVRNVVALIPIGVNKLAIVSLVGYQLLLRNAETCTVLEHAVSHL